MSYQILHMGYYVIKKLKVHSFRRSVKQFAVDGITIILIACATAMLSGTEISWLGWLVLAVKHAVIIAACILTTNFVFYNKEMMQMIKKVFQKKS